VQDVAALKVSLEGRSLLVGLFCSLVGLFCSVSVDVQDVEALKVSLEGNVLLMRC